MRTTEIQRIFPSFDEPTFQATYNIHISHPSELLVLSNTPIRQEHTLHRGYTTWKYLKETIIPPNIVKIVASNFTRNPDKAVSFDCRPQTALHLGYAEMVIENFTLHLESHGRYCKEPRKIIHIAIPDFHQESMSYLNFVFYR